MTRPRGRPPTPKAMSRPREPVGMVSISTACWFFPSRMIEPLPNARSICERAASSALVLSTEVPFHEAEIRLSHLNGPSGLPSRKCARAVDRLNVPFLFSHASSFFVLFENSLAASWFGSAAGFQPDVCLRASECAFEIAVQVITSLQSSLTLLNESRAIGSFPVGLGLRRSRFSDRAQFLRRSGRTPPARTLQSHAR